MAEGLVALVMPHQALAGPGRFPDKLVSSV